MSHRTLGRAVGALFLAAFAAYGTGALLAQSVTSAPDLMSSVTDRRTVLAGGVLAILLNSAIVTALGLFAHRALHERYPLAATTYLVTRVFEATVLAMGAVFLATLLAWSRNSTDARSVVRADPDAVAALLPMAHEMAYQVAMLGLGVGSVVFCHALLRSGMVPHWLARWGMAGYAVFALGAAAELAGLPIGLWLTIPGGLFEVAVGVVLLRHGFRDGAAALPTGIARTAVRS